jgi:hypothetical protein
MALIKDVELPNGISISYWRIGSIQISVESEKAEVHVVGYLDKATRDANKNPVQGKSFALPALQLADLDLLGNNPYKLAYEALKNESFFSDATDDL